MPITYLDEPIKPKSRITYLDEPISNSDKVENLISGRKSSIDVNNPINPINLTPFGGSKMIPESLRALSGGMEIAEGIPADIGLGFQRARETGGKSIAQIPSDIWKTLKGERPAELGDIYRGAGAPESVAATGGLLASASRLTPSGAFGDKLVRGVGKTLEPVLSPVGSAIKKGTSKVMSGLSGVPEKSVNLAIKNPNVLKKKYVGNQIKLAGQEMEKNVNPLINDPSAMVTATPRITNLGKNLNLYTPQGSETKILSAMQPNEKKMITDWLVRADNGSGKIDFNEADKIVGEIDSELVGYYRALKKGDIYKRTQFDRIAQDIRSSVNEARKSQFPDAGKAIDSYSQAMQSKTANEAFSRPFSRKYLLPKMGLQAGLALLNLPAAGAIAAASSPLLQGIAIKGASALGKTANQAINPALMAQILRKLNRDN